MNGGLNRSPMDLCCIFKIVPGFSESSTVSCPLFRSCHSYGETVDEALKNIREVIEMSLDETKTKDLSKFIGFKELEVAQNV